MQDKEIVRTSDENWLEKAVRLYTERKQFILIDDKNIGLTEKVLISAISLLRFAKLKGGISWQEIVGVLVGLGITGVGVWMVAAAIADPEPTSKLGLLIAGGIILALTGSLGTLAALGIRFTVSANSPGGSFVIKPEEKNEK